MNYQERLNKLLEAIANPDYDLKLLYNKFNAKYFNGELNTYPLKWVSRKGVGGYVNSIGQRNNPSSYKIQYIAFSKYYKFDDARMFGLMLHEMIHVW